MDTTRMMDYRVKRIYIMMAINFGDVEMFVHAAKHELETLIELKEAEVKWIRQGSK